jgi:hypothetical protein
MHQLQRTLEMSRKFLLIKNNDRKTIKSLRLVQFSMSYHHKIPVEIKAINRWKISNTFIVKTADFSITLLSVFPYFVN